MLPTVTEALTDTEWDQVCAVLVGVYGGEGWTARDVVERNMTRANLSTGGTLLIAKDADGNVCGATLFLLADGPMRQIARDGEREFRVLAVSAAGRGQGVGEALVRACIARAKEAAAAALVLWTQPTMKAAQRLYERLGFVRDAARDVPDPRGFDRMVYVLPLTDR